MNPMPVENPTVRFNTDPPSSCFNCCPTSANREPLSVYVTCAPVDCARISAKKPDAMSYRPKRVGLVTSYLPRHRGFGMLSLAAVALNLFLLGAETSAAELA